MKKVELRTSQGYGTCGEYTQLEIEDPNSGTKIIRISLTHKQLGELLGRGYTEGGVVSMLYKHEHDRLGKTLEVQTLLLELPDGVNSRELTEECVVHFYEEQYPNYVYEGWLIKRDGLTCRQDIRGIHSISVCRFVDERGEEDGT